MSWSHLFILLIAAVVGYYIGTKKPGLLTKATFGMVAA